VRNDERRKREKPERNDPAESGIAAAQRDFREILKQCVPPPPPRSKAKKPDLPRRLPAQPHSRTGK
jgi:hypothetical protein